MKGKFEINMFWKVVVFYLVFYYGGLEVLFPLISKWAVGSTDMLHMPAAALAMYRALIFTGLFIYISSSADRRKAFMEPLVRFFGDTENKTLATMRMGVLVALPLVVGAGYFSDGIPRLISPAGVRIQHPTMPGSYEGLLSPFRNVSEKQVQDFQSRKAEEGQPIAGPEDARKALVEKHTREGASLYAINCRPCHGMQANGEGPMARGFRLKPANFRDPGLLPTIVESYAFWRVSKGGPGLSSAATPWDSAMPIWELNLTEEERWKVLLGEYFISGVNPREPEKHE
ncbi:MAG: cytochrome c [Deltaproteobacteria bacterium]|nr:cytochrome c [Deltaproteobacteria bacterium]